MNKIEIDDLISVEEQKEIAREIFKEQILNDKERILINFAYNIGTSYVQEILEEKDLQFVKEYTHKVLNEKSSIRYQLFKDMEVWEKRKNTPSEIIEKAIIDNKQILINKTIEALNNIDVDEMSENMTTNMDTLLSSILNVFVSNKDR
jgi:hypothetical protein